MAFRGALAAEVLGFGIACASLSAFGVGGCGGSSVEHVSDGGTSGGGGGTGGNASAGTGGGTPPLCTGTVETFAGREYVDWSVSPDLSCEGTEMFCYQSSDPSIQTCLDGGVPEPGGPSSDPAPPAPPIFGCPNVRTLCSTQVGCCESIYTLVAGPRVTFDGPETLPCCYLARPGSYPR